MIADRIVPYMKRRTADEYRRRRQEVLDAFWTRLLLPVYLLAMMFGGDEGDQ